MAYFLTRGSRRLSKDELDDKVYEFEVKCHETGLKMTLQRSAVYRALLEFEDHPSAEAVFNRVRKTIPNISLDTVNRTLATLGEMGVAFVVEGSGDARRFDANLESHQHFKCIKCKRIIDFFYAPFENIAVPTIFGDKFTVLRKTVYFEGICDVCSKEK